LDIGLLLEQESRIKGLTFDNSFKTSAKGVWFCSVLIIVSKCVKSRCHFLYLMAIMSYCVDIYNNYWYEFGFYFWHLSFCFHEETTKSNPFCTCFKTIVKSQQPSASKYLWFVTTWIKS
jgi:hypothetical protein